MTSGSEREEAYGGPLLDAAAFLALVRDLYPVRVSELYYELELFLEETARSSPAPVPTPADLVSHNLATAPSRSQGGAMDLMPAPADVVATFDPAGRRTWIAFSGREAPMPGETEAPWPLLRIVVPGAGGLTRTVAAPLQVLLSGWGDVTSGYCCALHGIDFLDGGTGQPIERWRVARVSDVDWLAPMDRQEREVRAGTDRHYRAAWQDYAGACRVVLGSHLVAVGQSIEAALAWETSAVQRLSDAGVALNLTPGGRTGLQFLVDHGVLGSPAVPLAAREPALQAWVLSGEAEPWCPPVPHLLAPSWIDLPTYFRRLASDPSRTTPSRRTTARRPDRPTAPMD